MSVNNVKQLKKRIGKLEKSEEKYSVIFNKIPTGISLLDADGFIIDCNQFYCDMLGYSKEEMIGKHITAFIDSKYTKLAKQKFMELKKTGVLYAELELKRSDGSLIYVSRTANAVFDKNGNIDKIIVLTNDITGRKDYEKSILRLATVVEQATQTIVITDLDGNIEYVNPAFEETTGYSFNKVKGKNLRILKSCEHPPEFYKEIWDTLNKGNIWRGEVINKNKDGNNYYENAVIFAVKDKDGKIINYAKIAENITELKKAKNSLHNQEELLRAIINSTPDIICFKDGQGRWLEANDADLKLFQLDNVDYRGKKDSELAKYSNFYYDAFMTCEATDEIAWQKGEISRGVEMIPKPDGSKKVYDVIKVPLFNEDGSRKGLVVLGRDITEMKQKEE